MIHQFNFECEDEGHVKWLDAAYGKLHDEHGENFKKWMKSINKDHGLNVTKSGYGSIADLSIEAHDALSRFAGQNYANALNEIEAQEKMHGHKILKHTEDFSAFTVFM